LRLAGTFHSRVFVGAAQALTTHVAVAACHTGFFLVLAQPFRLGDKVAISCTAAGSPIPGSTAAAAAVKAQPGGTVAAAASSNSYGTHRMSQGSGQSTASSSNSREAASPPGWFEGICEKVDLRYTVLRYAACLD
jgi:hypothetical protein